MIKRFLENNLSRFTSLMFEYLLIFFSPKIIFPFSFVKFLQKQLKRNEIVIY